MVVGGNANGVASMNLQEMLQLKSEKIGAKTAAELQLLQRKAST